MALPNNFSPWEHLQDTWRRVHNRRVREHFSDLAGVDDDWDAEIESPRGSLRVACTMLDSDSASMVNLRTLLFWLVLGQASALQTPIYGIPIPSYQEARKFRPQIQLYFQEDVNNIDEGYSPVTGEITFRLMSQSPETLTEAELQNYANRIRSGFATGAGFQWQKGKVMCTYTDNSKGYKLQLLCRNKSEARRIIEQVLDIQNHTPDWKLLNVSENEEPASRYPTIPPNQRILNKTRRSPRQRPTATVRFKYASMHIHGLPLPIVLVDRSGIFRNPIIRA